MPGNSKKKICVKTTLMLVFACFLCSCNSEDNTVVTTINTSTEDDGGYHPLTDERGIYAGQDKEVPGYYKRVSITKEGETIEELKELLEEGKKGFLVVKDDGTAYSDLDGEKTEYVFDKQYFYLCDDIERVNGFEYVWLNGRLLISDGDTVTQYLNLTEEELEDYLNSN
jgi:hypothetical protein